MATNLVRYLKLFTFCLLAGSAKAQTPAADGLKNLLDYSLGYYYRFNLLNSKLAIHHYKIASTIHLEVRSMNK
jgi:hypothetical protein